ncbi:MAG: PAS domain S-box-containing protein [Chlamydiales bacterium]|jgi:PAS domain S-box-containing protein
MRNIGGVCVVTLLLIVGIYSYQNLRKVSGSLDSMLVRHQLLEKEIAELKAISEKSWENSLTIALDEIKGKEAMELLPIISADALVLKIEKNLNKPEATKLLNKLKNSISLVKNFVREMKETEGPAKRAKLNELLRVCHDITNTQIFEINKIISKEQINISQSAVGAIESNQITFLALILMILGLFTLMSIYISRLITQSLKKLTDGIEEFEADQEDYIIEIDTGDEFAHLANAYNTLTQSLHARNKAIKSQMRRLRENDEEMTILLHKMGDGILVLDLDGKVVKCNPALSNMFGHHYLTSNLIGKYCSDAFGEEINSLMLTSFQCTSRMSSSEIILNNGKTGQAVCSFLYPKKMESRKIGTYSAFVVVIRDITKEKELLNMKDSFISTVSHELRTPLASILGFTSLVKKRLEFKISPYLPTEEKQVMKWYGQTMENIDIVLEEGERLSKLINDVLDIAKLESVQSDWDMDFYDVERLIDQAMCATSSLFEYRDVEIKKEVDRNLPQVFGDRDKLIQVLINLISNAEKFTEKGSVTCRAVRVRNEIEISIIDTGVGISEDNVQLVFDKFKQVGDILENKPKGSGLGLYISKQIVQNHNGKIWVESKLDEGTVFFFRIPAKVIKYNIGK